MLGEVCVLLSSMSVNAQREASDTLASLVGRTDDLLMEITLLFAAAYAEAAVSPSNTVTNAVPRRIYTGTL